MSYTSIGSITGIPYRKDETRIYIEDELTKRPVLVEYNTDLAEKIENCIDNLATLIGLVVYDEEGRKLFIQVFDIENGASTPPVVARRSTLRRHRGDVRLNARSDDNFGAIPLFLSLFLPVAGRRPAEAPPGPGDRGRAPARG